MTEKGGIGNNGRDFPLSLGEGIVDFIPAGHPLLFLQVTLCHSRRPPLSFPHGPLCHSRKAPSVIPAGC